MSVVIEVENLSKQYRLGTVSTGTFSHDLNRWWHRVRGKQDPYELVTTLNAREEKGQSEYVWALEDINFKVNQGEVLGIIGRNGAGKSTLLKLLSKVTAPTKGNIRVNGRIASLLEVGTGFHPELTGRENIFLNGAILGMSKIEIKSKFDEIVDFSGVEKYIDTPVKRYSSGMYVRLAFGVAAHLEPEILIVDEVLAVGDAEFQKKCLGKMKDVSGQGRTVLFVSHNMAAVKTLCTKGIILKNGKMIFSGTSDAACSKYLESSEQNSLEEISQRKDRHGSGELIVTDIYFADINNRRAEDLISGEYAKLKIHFKKTVPDKISNVFLGVTVRNDLEVVQTVLASDECGLSFEIDSEEGVFEFELPRLLLRAGRYSISFLLSKTVSAISGHLPIDRIENSNYISVEPGDFFKVGNINRPNGFIQDMKLTLK